MPPLPAHTLAAAQAGSAPAIAALVSWALPLIRQTVRFRAEPDAFDDLVQDTILAIMLTVPQCRGAESLTGWVRAVARTQAGMHHRRERLRRTVPLAPSLAAHARCHDDRLDLELAFKAVNAETRRALRRHAEGYTLEEIARMEGMTESGIKARVARGRARLRERLVA